MRGAPLPGGWPDQHADPVASTNDADTANEHPDAVQHIHTLEHSDPDSDLDAGWADRDPDRNLDPDPNLGRPDEHADADSDQDADLAAGESDHRAVEGDGAGGCP